MDVSPLFFPQDAITAIAILSGSIILYSVGLILYRLFVHPLASIPGPRLAAATGWYDTYYQLFKGPQLGQMIFHVEELHRQYGPIVRITPDELHINDPEFYEIIYSSGRNIDKPSSAKWVFGSPGTLFSAADSEVHRVRRASMNPFFSKQKVVQQESRIRQQLEKMCSRMNEEYVGTNNVLRADYMFSSVSCDIVAAYAFDRSQNMLDAPKFTSPFIYSIDSFKEAGMYNAQFPLLPQLIGQLPESWLKAMVPQVIPSLQFKQKIKEQIIEIKRGIAEDDVRAKGTIFWEIFNARLPSSEMKDERLTDEAGGVVAAALETTKRILTVMFFYTLSKSHILDKLRQEMAGAMPDSLTIPPVSELEKLPYLMAVVQESLRLGYGVVSRNPRLHKSKSLRYKEYVIPPGTPISCSTYTMHHNEILFPESHAFRPERWLNSPIGPGGKPLARYMVAFSKGTRNCIGMQLAYAVIELTVATIITRFDLELYDTTEKDIICTCDKTAPGVFEDSQGLRLLVRAREK